MRKVPSNRPGGLSPAKSPAKSHKGLTSEASRSVRANYRTFKKAMEALDLLQKKRQTFRRTEEDLGNLEVYAIVLQEKLSKKDAKIERPNKRMLENRMAELATMRETMDQLMKELEARRETLETLKSFFGHMIREFQKHIRGYQDGEREKVEWPRLEGQGTGPLPKLDRLRKSKSTNEIANRLPKSPKDVNLANTLRQEKVQEPEALNPEQMVKVWGLKRRPSLINGKAKPVPTASMETLPVVGEELLRRPTGILAQALLKDGEDGRGRTSTVRFRIDHHVQFNPATGLLNKSNIRQSVLGDSENLMNIRDFARISKAHGKRSRDEVIDLMHSKTPASVPEDAEEETSLANSNLSDSIIEEVKEDLKSKMMKQNSSAGAENAAFDYKVVVPNFQPVKVSFKVGVADHKLTQDANHLLHKDRVFKGFAIFEIEWHFKNKGLCGVRIILKNWDTGFMLSGAFHGKIGDLVDVCRFNKDERIAKIEFAFDSLAIRFLEFATTQGRRFLNGLDRKEAMTMGLNFVNRYYPQEIMLCKFFCQFNKHTQFVDYIRFLFVRAVLY